MVVMHGQDPYERGGVFYSERLDDRRPDRNGCVMLGLLVVLSWAVVALLAVGLWWLVTRPAA